jgi:eukaryotic-like serine/threonine-protein kinase
MAFKTRVWSVGKLLILFAALVATYVLFAAASMRLAIRAREVEVPNLIERTVSEAGAMAAAQSLTIRVDEARRPDPKIPVDHVTAQEPAAGSTAREQRSVRVWLSAGPRAGKVPTLTGEPERVAAARLTQDGFEVGAVSEIRSQTYPADVVVAQDPAGDQSADKVSLLVNRGEQGVSYVMPDLIGVSGERAAEILRDRGFRVAVVGSMPYAGVPAGIVLRQNPRAGFQIAPGEPISLEVSR